MERERENQKSKGDHSLNNDAALPVPELKTFEYFGKVIETLNHLESFRFRLMNIL